MTRSDGRLGPVDVYQGCFGDQKPDWACRLPTLDQSLPYIHLQGQSKQVSAGRRLALGSPSPSECQIFDVSSHHETLRMSCGVGPCWMRGRRDCMAIAFPEAGKQYHLARGKCSQGGGAQEACARGIFCDVSCSSS